MVNQYQIYWVSLDQTLGSEINKTRPCIIISPNESNNLLKTVIIAPITSSIRNFPMRINIILQDKNGQICLDQLRCIDKSRLKNSIEILSNSNIKNLKKLIQEYLVE